MSESSDLDSSSGAPCSPSSPSCLPSSTDSERSREVGGPHVAASAAAVGEHSEGEQAEAASASGDDEQNEAASASGDDEQNDAVPPGRHGSETFVEPFESLEEHVRSHSYPAHVKTCGPCKFWSNRWQWTAQATFHNSSTGKDETWLACKNGAAVCLVCAAYRGNGKLDVRCV